MFCEKGANCVCQRLRYQNISFPVLFFERTLLKPACAAQARQHAAMPFDTPEFSPCQKTILPQDSIGC